jgi:hypothetical protein
MSRADRLLPWIAGERILRAVLLMAAGLAVFVASLSPTEGHPLAVGPGAWTVGLAVLFGVVAGLALLGRRLVGERRGLLLGAAAGVGYGATAVLFAATGATAARIGVGVFSTWQPYAAVAFGGLSFYLLQNGLAAGKLVAAAPGLTLANPLVAVLWGVLLFGEQPRTGMWLIGAAVGAVALALGVVMLARSPLLAGPERAHADGSPGDRVDAAA